MHLPCGDGCARRPDVPRPIPIGQLCGWTIKEDELSGRKSLLALTLLGALLVLSTCQREPDYLKRIEILPNYLLAADTRPTLLATNLDNPESPFLYEGNVVFSQSGKGEISMVSQKGGPVKPLITGFAFDMTIREPGER